MKKGNKIEKLTAHKSTEEVPFFCLFLLYRKISLALSHTLQVKQVYSHLGACICTDKIPYNMHLKQVLANGKRRALNVRAVLIFTRRISIPWPPPKKKKSQLRFLLLIIFFKEKWHISSICLPTSMQVWWLKFATLYNQLSFAIVKISTLHQNTWQLPALKQRVTR